jgi:hypothetical protein
MAKRKRYAFQTTIKNRLKQGRGLGVLSEYKPWLYIQDVPSKGLSTRIKGITTNRIHHLLSKLELYCFLCLDWSEKVIDIREQYPLYFPETLAIAKQLNIKHPKVPKTGENIVMTTDFLVTLYDSLMPKDVAISVKYSKDLNNLRTINKLEIERFYWHRRNVEWRIITELQINQILVSNINWVRPYFHIDSFIDSINIEVANIFLDKTIQKNNLPLREITNSCDDYFSFETGTSLAIVRHLIANRYWLVDMTQPIQPAKPLSIISKNSEGGF